MDKRSKEPIPPNTNSDKEIIKEILSEKERDADVKDRMYAIYMKRHQPMKQPWIPI